MIVPLFVISWLPPLCDIPVALIPELVIFPVAPFVIVEFSARIPTEPWPISISPKLVPTAGTGGIPVAITYIPEPSLPTVIFPVAWFTTEPLLAYIPDELSPVNVNVPAFVTFDFSE